MLHPPPPLSVICRHACTTSCVALSSYGRATTVCGPLRLEQARPWTCAPLNDRRGAGRCGRGPVPPRGGAAAAAGVGTASTDRADTAAASVLSLAALRWHPHSSCLLILTAATRSFASLEPSPAPFSSQATAEPLAHIIVKSNLATLHQCCSLARLICRSPLSRGDKEPKNLN